MVLRSVIRNIYLLIVAPKEGAFIIKNHSLCSIFSENRKNYTFDCLPMDLIQVTTVSSSKGNTNAILT